MKKLGLFIAYLAAACLCVLLGYAAGKIDFAEEPEESAAWSLPEESRQVPEESLPPERGELPSVSTEGSRETEPAVPQTEAPAQSVPTSGTEADPASAGTPLQPGPSAPAPAETPARHVHQYDRLISCEPAGCLHLGEEVWACACGSLLRRILPFAEHEPEWIPAVPAAYQKPGRTESQVCRLCGTVLQQGREIPALTLSDVAYSVRFALPEAIGAVPEGVTPLSDGRLYSCGADGDPSRGAENFVSFRLRVPAGLSPVLHVTGEYGSLEEEDGYWTIRGMRSHLTVTVTAEELAPGTSQSPELLAEFGSYVFEDGRMHFVWEPDRHPELSSVLIRVLVRDPDYRDPEGVDVAGTNTSEPGEEDPEEEDTDDGRWKELCVVTADAAAGEWDWQAEENTAYRFIFRPYSLYEAGKPVRASRMYAPSAAAPGIARVEIETETWGYPYARVVYAPEGLWGIGLTEEEYMSCAVRLFSETGSLLYDSGAALPLNERFAGAGMRLRGNTSGAMEKASYKLKLGERIDLLADLLPQRQEDGIFHQDRQWLLLASGESLNQLGGSAVARLAGMDYVPDSVYVALFVNGDYRGLYILTENVKQGAGTGETQGRVAVPDTGYILEADAYWWNEAPWFRTPYTEGTHLGFTFKYPDEERLEAEPEAIEIIQAYLEAAEKAILAGGDAWTKYFEPAHMAGWLLAHDYMATIDAGGSNIYMTKKDREAAPLVMGPLWDFDSCFRRTGSLSGVRWMTDFYFPLLTENETFRAQYLALYQATKDRVAGAVLSAMEAVGAEAYDARIALELERWGFAVRTADEQKEAAEAFLKGQLEYMEAEMDTIAGPKEQ